MKIKIVVIIMLIGLRVVGQQYAGEDKICCSGNGAAIGVDNPDPNHCYLWEVADGLTKSQVNEKQPIVKPDRTTTYTVTVTDQFFTFKSIDKVKVTVYFGGIKFYPTFIFPNGQQNQAKATLTENGYESLPPDPITWSVHSDPDGTGAVISQDGWISNCTQSGTVTIRATNSNNPACYDDEEIEVNVGVKDLIVNDMVNEGRKAKHGETLYIVKQPSSTYQVQFHALPNDESTFPEGQPEWSGNPSAPPGIGSIWTSDLSVGTYTVTAGEKTVTVIVSTVLPLTVQKAINIEKVKSFREKLVTSYSPPIQSPHCTPIPIGITLPAENLTLAVALEEVNKFENPNLGTKIDFSIALPAIGASGCLPLINLSIIVKIPGVGDVWIFPYIRAAAGITVSGNVTKDPSVQMSNWDGTLNVVGKIELGAGIGVDASLGPFGLSAGGDASADYTMKCRLQEGVVEWNSSSGGLQVKFAGYAYLGSPSNPTHSTPTFELGPFKIIDGFETPYSQLIDLNVD